MLEGLIDSYVCTIIVRYLCHDHSEPVLCQVSHPCFHLQKYTCCLKHTVRDVNENLGSQLSAATQMSMHLKNQLAEGDGVIRRLSKIASAARPAQAPDLEPETPKLSPAKAVAVAAQAFSERRRANGLAA